MMLSERPSVHKFLYRMSMVDETNSIRFFWQNGPGGLVHHDDFWDQVAENVQVYRDEIKSLNEKVVRLEGGLEFPCDAILCGTGWHPSIEFFDNQLLIQLGLPHNKKDDPEEDREKWSKLTDEADKEICDMLPMLANPPPAPIKKTSRTPYRLYQGIAPIHDDSIVILNHVLTGNKLLAAEVQAIWAVAYFDKHIALPSVEEREKDIARWIVYSRRRYLSNGQLGNAINFDSITYADRLLKELGLSAHNKSWWNQQFEPFWPRDLGRAWVEYLKKYKKKDADDTILSKDLTLSE
jgi:dimethylaniline monooxygenase (N-oxide forming)